MLDTMHLGRQILRFMNHHGANTLGKHVSCASVVFSWGPFSMLSVGVQANSANAANDPCQHQSCPKGCPTCFKPGVIIGNVQKYLCFHTFSCSSWINSKNSQITAMTQIKSLHESNSCLKTWNGTTIMFPFWGQGRGPEQASQTCEAHIQVHQEVATFFLNLYPTPTLHIHIISRYFYTILADLPLGTSKNRNNIDPKASRWPFVASSGWGHSGQHNLLRQLLLDNVGQNPPFCRWDVSVSQTLCVNEYGTTTQKEHHPAEDAISLFNIVLQSDHLMNHTLHFNSLRRIKHGNIWKHPGEVLTTGKNWLVLWLGQSMAKSACKRSLWPSKPSAQVTDTKPHDDRYHCSK